MHTKDNLEAAFETLATVDLAELMTIRGGLCPGSQPNCKDSGITFGPGIPTSRFDMKPFGY